MIRLQGVNRRMVRFVFGRYGPQVLLAACVAMGSAGAAAAFGAAPLAGIANAIETSGEPGAALVPVGVCADGSYVCPGYEPAPVERGGHAYGWTPPPEPYEYDKPPKPRRSAIEVETVVEEVPCEEVEYAAHGKFERVAPPGEYHPRDYREPDYDDSCGVRCWYRRLRMGYCGRGCDYYRYRLTEYPRGNLAKYRRKQLACRSH